MIGSARCADRTPRRGVPTFQNLALVGGGCGIAPEGRR
jgi:hypothetical protein